METQDEWRSGEALMTRPKDDWEKVPRKGSAHFTEAEIETMKAGYRNGRPARDVARELKCSSRSVVERYRAWRQAGMKKREPRTIDRAARFYTSGGVSARVAGPHRQMFRVLRHRPGLGRMERQDRQSLPALPTLQGDRRFGRGLIGADDR
jgi:hypothetical protein